ncbi:MAG: hypothetical protein WD533_06170 [Dehalococcoidia bacterium]
MQPNGPLLTDKSRISLIQLLIPGLILYLVVLGVTQGDPVGIVVGVALALYFVFTFHFRYELYQDVLVIRFLAPRRKAVLLADIEDAQVIRVPLRGETLLIRRRTGGPMLLRPANTEQFLMRLNQARS